VIITANTNFMATSFLFTPGQKQKARSVVNPTGLRLRQTCLSKFILRSMICIQILQHAIKACIIF